MTKNPTSLQRKRLNIRGNERKGKLKNNRNHKNSTKKKNINASYENETDTTFRQPPRPFSQFSSRGDINPRTPLPGMQSPISCLVSMLCCNTRRIRVCMRVHAPTHNQSYQRYTYHVTVCFTAHSLRTQDARSKAFLSSLATTFVERSNTTPRSCFCVTSCRNSEPRKRTV